MDFMEDFISYMIYLRHLIILNCMLIICRMLATLMRSLRADFILVILIWKYQSKDNFWNWVWCSLSWPKKEKRKKVIYCWSTWNSWFDHSCCFIHIRCSFLRAALIKMFSPYGKIVSEDFLWHTRGPKRGVPRGFAFIEYSTKEVS